MYEAHPIGREEAIGDLLDKHAVARIAGASVGAVRNWWSPRGVTGPHGHRIRLRSIRTPAGRRTTRDWLDAFLNAYDGRNRISDDAEPSERTVKPQTKRTLERMGMNV